MSAVPSNRAAEVARPHTLAEEISAFLDGEGEMPNALASTEARECWDTYHLIGDVLRTPDLAVKLPSDFSQRFSAALEDEPTILAPQARPKSGFLRRYAAPGATLALFAVAVTWALQPYMTPASGVEATLPAHEVYAAHAVRSNPELVDYYDVHRQVAGMNGFTQVSYAPGRE